MEGPIPSAFDPIRGGPRRGILFVGRLTPHKGVDRLIEALPEDAGLRAVGRPGTARTRPNATIRTSFAGYPRSGVLSASASSPIRLALLGTRVPVALAAAAQRA
jgi:hypothetical protein